MKHNFDAVLVLTLQHEGGYVDHPKDPGGRTNFGVIQRTYNAYRDRRGLARQSVRYIDKHEVRDIYRRDYWDRVLGDNLPVGIDYTVFDASVNSGTGRGPKWTQKALGVAADGKVGMKTLQAAINLTEEQTVTVIKKANGFRLGFLKGLGHWKTFGRGWARRVAEVEAGSIGMVSGSHVLRDESKASRTAARNESGGTAGTALGTGGIMSLDVPDYVIYGAGAAVAILVVIAVKRILAHLDRAEMMNKVADQLDHITGED